jgi:hypothetical protein
MRIEPNDAALPMVEARKYALADIAAASECQGKLFGRNRLPDNPRESLAYN